MIRIACCLLLVLIVTACGGNRSDRAMGLIIDTDGTMLSTTDHNVRQVHQNQTVEALRAAAEHPDAPITLSVAQLPVHGYDHDDFPFWAYPAATIGITVPADFPLADAAIVELAAEHFRPKLLPPARSAEERLQVTVERVAVAAAPAPPAPAASATEPAESSPPNARTTYLVQPGDTLAEISAAYYGSAQHWRLIKDANPGLELDLEPGTRLTIPPRP
jgi:nucleoid-associated protein YgaU